MLYVGVVYHEVLAAIGHGSLADVAWQPKSPIAKRGSGLHASEALQLHIHIHRHDTVSFTMSDMKHATCTNKITHIHR
jgi:hypothetical protein